MNVWWPILIDVLVVLVIIICVVSYAKQGFLAGIVRLIGTMAAVAISFFASGHIAKFVFNTFFSKKLAEKTAQAFAEQGNLNLEELLGSLAQLLPKNTLQEMSEAVAQRTDLSAQAMSDLVVNKIISPIVVPIIAVLVFLILFIILIIIVTIVSKVLTGANKVPVIGAANRVLGGVVGIFLAVVYAALLLIAAHVVVGFWLSNEARAGIFDKSFAWDVVKKIELIYASALK